MTFLRHTVPPTAGASPPHTHTNTISHNTHTGESMSMGNKGGSMSRWWYVLAAFVDFEANFLVISAFNYTSFTSVALLDCFTIPSAMGLSYFFLGCRCVIFHL